MSERITDLRRRMIEDMTVRNLSPATQASYITAVKKFSRYYRRSPEHLGIEDVRTYQVHLVENAIAWASLNQTVSALRFLYGVTLGRKDLPERIPYARKPKTLPVVLSAAEVARLIEAVDDLVCRTVLATVYATGLRTAEVLSLRIAHIESARGLIRVEQGKGRKDRYVMLSATLLAPPRAYWKIARPRRWLFTQPDGQGPLGATTLNKACMRAALVARIGKPVTVKTLRHCFATHLLEQGTDIRVIQALLETTTNCPPTAGRGADLLSLPSALRGNGAHPEALRLSRHRAGGHSAAGWLGCLYSGVDDGRGGGKSSAV